MNVLELTLTTRDLRVGDDFAVYPASHLAR